MPLMSSDSQGANWFSFGAIPFALPTSSSTVLLRRTKFLSLICMRILLFVIDIRRSSLKILSKCITPVHMVQTSSGKCRLIFYLSYLNRFVHFGSNPFGTKIIALCFICFSRASFSSPLLSNLDIITSKIFSDHRQNLGFLGVLVQLSNTSFLLFCFAMSSVQVHFHKVSAFAC